MKEWFENNKKVTAGIAVGVLAIGIGGLVWGIGYDRSTQEKRVEEVSIETDTQTYNEGAFAETAGKVETIDKGGYTVQLVGEGPDNPNITLEKAADIGNEALLKITKEDLGKYNIEMSYTDYSGTTDSGNWRGEVNIDGDQLVEFIVDAVSGQLEECKAYTKAEVNASWKSGQREKIEEKQLPAFSKIDFELLSNLTCVITSGDAYGLYMDRMDRGYTVAYEVKGDTLFIKETGEEKQRYIWNNDELKIIIPEGIELEQILSDSTNSSIEMKNIKCKVGTLLGDNISADISKCQLNELEIDMVNGSVTIEDSQISKANIAGVNGSCDMEETQVEDCDMKLTNGAINFGKDMKGKIKARIVNGGINVEESEEESECIYDLEVETGEVSRDGESSISFGGMNFWWG